MSPESAILTKSGFERASTAKEDVAKHVQRLRQGPARFVIISTGQSTTGSMVVTESEDTLDEPWARQIAAASQPYLHNVATAQQNQSIQDLRRFWDSVSEHTQGQHTGNIRLTTFAHTGQHSRPEDRTPDQQAPPLCEVAAEIARQVPDADWAKVPSDLAKNVDHYLYGTPKRKDNA